MKKITLILLVFVAAIFALTTNTGCSGGTNPIPQDTTSNDTTPEKTISNGFTAGFDVFKLDVVDALTYGVYNKAANKTYIFVSGNDGTRPENEQDADIAIELDSNIVGTFTKNEGARIDLGTGSGIKRTEYTSDGYAVTVVITQYDAPGGRIKGTFSGTIKAANQVSSVQLKSGYFDVKRKDDE